MAGAKNEDAAFAPISLMGWPRHSCFRPPRRRPGALSQTGIESMVWLRCPGRAVLPMGFRRESLQTDIGSAMSRPAREDNRSSDGRLQRIAAKWLLENDALLFAERKSFFRRENAANRCKVPSEERWLSSRTHAIVLPIGDCSRTLRPDAANQHRKRGLLLARAPSC